MPRARRVRRAMPLTALIDVIFLLLLFFMLATTFSRRAEIDLAAAPGAAGAAPARPPLFLTLGPERLAVNGRPVALAGLGPALAGAAPGDAVLVGIDPGTDAQRLTDLLAALRARPDLRVGVLADAP